MAIALLLTTLLALAGFLATSAQGLLVSSALHTAAPIAGRLVTRHVGFAIPTVLFSLFSQSMVIFYFIGTGKLVKEEVASYPEPERRAVLGALRRLRGEDCARPASLGELSRRDRPVELSKKPHTSALPAWTHLTASISAVAIHTWALLAEWKTFAENHELMNNPRAYARRLRM